MHTLALPRTPHLETSIRKKIEAEAYVQRLLELVPVGEHWEYLIETPFETFPRFVIGQVDAAVTTSRVLFRCGLETSGREEWKRRRA